MPGKIQIIATIGPASNSFEAILDLVKGGTTIFRLNFAHGSYDEQLRVMESIHQAKAATGAEVGILIDLQGPRFRIGTIENNGIEIAEGQVLLFTNEPCLGNQERVYFSYDHFPNDVTVGDKVLVDDGRLIFQVMETDRTSIVKLKAQHGGILKSNKGVSLPETKLSLSALTRKDLDDLDFALGQQFDWIACPFIDSTEDLIQVQTLLNKANHPAKMLTKIEHIESVKMIEAILAYCEGVVWARGDLCIEHKTDDVFYAEKAVINICNKQQKIFFLATQIMDSMIVNATPTNAEIYGLAHAITDEVSGVILSGETSVGKHPAKAVEVLINIVNNISRKPKNRAFSKFIKVNAEFRTLLIQYFNFFNEYTFSTKKSKVKLNLSEFDEGIELRFVFDDPAQDDLALSYFKEYLAFISEKQESLKINFEREISHEEKNLFILSLRNEIQQLKFKLELKDMKIALLSQHIHTFAKTLQAESDQILRINLPVSSKPTGENLISSPGRQLCDELKAIRRKIANNELSTALSCFYTICELTTTKYLNEAVNFSKRYHELLRLDNLGLVPLDDRFRLENQIANSLLNTITQIEKEHCH